MSSLNLNPNGLVIAVQTGIFFTNFLVIKKFILRPYLDIRERRIQATTASFSSSESLRSQNEATQLAIQSKLAKAFDDIQESRVSTRSVAGRKRDEILSSAEKDAKGEIATALESIKQTIKQEREKLPKFVEQVSALVFKKLVN